MDILFAGPVGGEPIEFSTPVDLLLGLAVVIVMMLLVLAIAGGWRAVYKNKRLAQAGLVLTITGVLIGIFARYKCSVSGDCANMAPTWWIIIFCLFGLWLTIAIWIKKTTR